MIEYRGAPRLNALEDVMRFGTAPCREKFPFRGNLNGGGISQRLMNVRVSVCRDFSVVLL